MDHREFSLGRKTTWNMCTKPCINRVIKRLYAPYPGRSIHLAHKGIMITKITVHKQKKSKFFALAQSELGDVYKVVLLTEKTDKTKVIGMKIDLLDTLPMAISMNISELGMLFIASEFGNHVLYKFLRIDLSKAPSMSSDALLGTYETRQQQQAIQKEKDENSGNNQNETAIRKFVLGRLFNHNDRFRNCHHVSTDGITKFTKGIQYGQLITNYEHYNW